MSFVVSAPALGEAVKALHLARGVVALPLDTAYGVICRMDHPGAIERLCEIAGGRGSDRLFILGGSVPDVLAWATGDMTLPVVLGQRFWPGPLIISMRASEKVPAPLVGGKLNVSVAVPAHPAPHELVSRLPGGCAVAISCWSEEARELRAGEQARQFFDGLVDYVMEDGGSVLSGGSPTIIDASTSQVRVVSPGPLPASDLEEAINQSGRG